MLFNLKASISAQLAPLSTIMLISLVLPCISSLPNPYKCYLIIAILERLYKRSPQYKSNYKVLKANNSSSNESLSLNGRIYKLIPFSLEGSNSNKRVKRESLSIFDSNHYNAKHIGFIIVQGKQVYTDVFLFCEYLYIFAHYGEDCLQEHYSSILAECTIGWLIGELSLEACNCLLSSSITRFCNKLTARFKCLNVELLNEIHSR